MNKFKKLGTIDYNNAGLEIRTLPLHRVLCESVCGVPEIPSTPSDRRKKMCAHPARQKFGGRGALR